MASTFPTSIDNFTDPLSTSPLNSPSHSSQHANLNSAVNKIETFMGLVHISTTTFTATTAAQQIDNCFTSVYANYLIIFAGIGSTVNNELLMARMVNGTTPLASNYFYSTAFSGTSTMSTGFLGSQTEMRVGFVGNNVYQGYMTICNPQEVAKTTGLSTFMASSTNQFHNGNNGQMVNETTQFEGITFFPTSGTWSGTITVYGYRK